MGDSKYMKQQQQWLLFLKYPYSTGVLACIWIGSAVMIFIDRSMPVLLMITTNMIISWLITWLGFQSTPLK